MNTVAGGFTGGKGAIEGFVNDTANTLPLREPFMTATRGDVVDRSWVSAGGAGTPVPPCPRLFRR